MDFYPKKLMLLLLSLLVLLSACNSRTEESTFELPVTVTVRPFTISPRPTTEAIQGRDGERAMSKICFVSQKNISADDSYLNDIRQGIEAVVSDYGTKSIYVKDSELEGTKGIAKCVAKGAKIIVFPFHLERDEATLAGAEANPDLYFIGVDHFVDGGPPNYAGIQSNEDEAAFLVGYLAGLVTESNVVAGVYGVDFPPLKRFRNGYEQGVRLAAKHRDQEIEIVGTYLDSFEDPEAGAEAAQEFIDAGADVIFGAAGRSGNGAIIHAAQQGVYVIGADQDEYFTVFEGGKVEGADKIISSALKRVNVGVFNLLSILLEGDLAHFPGGSNYILTLANGGLTFANPHEANIPNEIYDKVAEVEQALANGKLSTGVDSATGDLLNETQLESVETIDEICLVAHKDLINDGGFFQYAYEGMQFVAQEQAIEGVYLDVFDNGIVETFNDPRMMGLVEQCLHTGADVVITVGFTSGDATLIAAEENPDVYFIGVDHFVEDGPANYAGVQARDDQAGFLAGYLAGLVTESNVVAGVYGPDDPPIKRFRNGYEQGVALAAQERTIEIERLGIYLDSYETPEIGAEAAQTFIDEGADVIFGAAGRSGNSAIRHGAAQGVYVIGLYQDEYFTTFQGGKAEGADQLITSALKRVDNGIITLLNALVNGDEQNFPGGSNYILTVENNGLTFANPHDADIPDEIYDQVAEIEQALARGELSTAVDPVTGELLDE